MVDVRNSTEFGPNSWALANIAIPSWPTEVKLEVHFPVVIVIFIFFSFCCISSTISSNIHIFDKVKEMIFGILNKNLVIRKHSLNNFFCDSIYLRSVEGICQQYRSVTNQRKTSVLVGRYSSTEKKSSKYAANISECTDFKAWEENRWNKADQKERKSKLSSFILRLSK